MCTQAENAPIDQRFEFPLETRLKKGALPLDQALQYVIQIADALDKAHRVGIVHRDMKPGNVMLTKSGAGASPKPTITQEGWNCHGT